MYCISTHWGRDKMAASSQTTVSIAFSWMKMLEFRFNFHWSLFLRVQLTTSQHWFRYWLGAGQATSHYLNQWWLVHWRIYVSLGLNELTQYSVVPVNFSKMLTTDTRTVPNAGLVVYFVNKNHILSQLFQCSMKHVLLDHVIMVPDCMW